MVAQLAGYAAVTYPGWGHGPGVGGPGWWLIFPILFWLGAIVAGRLIGYTIAPPPPPV